MPSTSDHETDGGPAACVACAVLVNGLALAVVSSLGLRSGAIAVIDELVRLETAQTAKRQAHLGLHALFQLVTTGRIFWGLSGTGVLVALAALVGIIGAKLRSRQLMATYVILAAVMTAVTTAGGISVLQRRQVVEPIVERQVLDLCNYTRYIRLAKHIPCPFAASYAPSEVPPCGAFCMWRVGLLRKLHACPIMHRLCQRFFYTPLSYDGGKNCSAAIEEHGSTMYMAAEGEVRCRELCDEDIRCTAYAYSGASRAKPERCVLGQAVAADHLPPRWSPIAPPKAAEYLAGGSSLSCYRRTSPVVLETFRKHGRRLVACALILAVVLLASTVISCCLVYNVNAHERGRPTAKELSLMMCCPCCSGDLHRQFSRPVILSDEGSDLDEEDQTSLADDAASRADSPRNQC